jgi:hypothetical protein
MSWSFAASFAVLMLCATCNLNDGAQRGRDVTHADSDIKTLERELGVTWWSSERVRAGSPPRCMAPPKG